MDLKGIVVVEPTPITFAGRRLGGETLTALQMVANRPILCHTLEALSNAGVKSVALVVAATARSAVSDSIATIDTPVEYFAYEPGVSIETALGAAARSIGEEPCILSIADGLLGQPIAPLLGLIDTDTPTLVALVHDGGKRTELVELMTHKVMRICSDAPPKPNLALAGVCLFGRSALAQAHTGTWCGEGMIDLAAAGRRLIADGGRLHVEQVSDWHRYLGEAPDLLEMNRLVLDSLASAPIPGTSRDIRTEGHVQIHPSAQVESSLIVGPAVIGAGARVLDSYIGPYTSIGAGAHIEGAEIERSIVLAGASIKHVGVRLVSSVVGRDARIFRDFSLPRAMRFQVGDGVEVALC